MFEFLGDLERGISALYPYRFPLTAAVLGATLSVVFVAWRRGWLSSLRRAAGRRPTASAAVVAALLLVTIPAGWYLASPLWTRTTLIEASPIEGARQAESAQPSPGVATVAPAAPSPAPVASGGASTTAPVAATPAALTAREVLRGEWVGADDFHFAEGQALIIETEPGRYVLRVEDFSIRNGPDLFVYLSLSPDGYEEGGLNLGELKATDGAFNYEVPEGTDLSAYRSAVVWCEQFAVLFATATLSP